MLKTKRGYKKMNSDQIVLEEVKNENIIQYGYNNDNSNLLNNILFKTIKEVSFSETISKIVSNRYYILEETPLLDLVDTLTNFPNILAVGVIDRNGSIKGVIVRKALLGLFSKAFAREVFKRETISAYLTAYPEEDAVFPRYFDHKENIFTVSALIKETLNRSENLYFVVTNENLFYGIFNSRDILLYLANVTQQDFSLSKKVQSKIVKEKEMSSTKDFSYSAVSSMALDVGGDFYTIKKITPDTFFIALCDVSGKGMSASLVSSFLYGFINSYEYKKGLKQFVIDMNDNLFSSFSGEKFVTGIFITFNVKTGIMNILDMGHSHYIIIKDSKAVHGDVEKTNMPLGVSASLSIMVQHLDISRGDRIFLTTDGLLEQDNSLGEMYSLDTAYKVISKNENKDINKITNSILKDFNTFKKGVVQHDDITFILCEYPKFEYKHFNEVQSISNNILNQIQESIYSEKPLQVKTSRYHPKTRNFVDEMLKKYLELMGKPQYSNNIAYCIHELATNAKKANVKRMYFLDKKLDINNKDDYEKGMKNFKIDTVNSIEKYLTKQKKKGYFIVISFQIKKKSLIIEVQNNAELTREEKRKIKIKLAAAGKNKQITEIYDEIKDSSEGAGLGIVMMKQLLKTVGSGNNLLEIKSKKNRTVAQLIINF